MRGSSNNRNVKVGLIWKLKIPNVVNWETRPQLDFVEFGKKNIDFSNQLDEN